MSTVLWTLAAVALCAGLVYVAHRIEPHWVARDGTRFLTTSEAVDRSGAVTSRRREVRGVILPAGDLMLTQRSLHRSSTSRWRIEAASPRPPRGRQLYVLRSVPPEPDGSMLVLRVPATSRLVAILDRLSPDPGSTDPLSVPTPGPRSRRWARRTDRG